MKNKINKSIYIYINIIEYNKKPAILLRRIVPIDNKELFKSLLSHTYREKPFICLPTTKNKLKFLSDLIEKKIIKEVIQDNNKEYVFCLN